MGRACFVLAAALFLGGRGASQETSAPGLAEPQVPAAALARSGNREHWERLSSEERQRLRQVYRQLLALPPAERESLFERLRKMPPHQRKKAIEMAQERLKGRAERSSPALAGSGGPDRTDSPRDKKARPAGANRPPLVPLPPEVRRRLERLSPEERAREMEAIVERYLRRSMERLPPRLREHIRRFTRREQVEFIRAYRETEMLLKTFPPESEEEALLALPSERLRVLPGQDAERPEGISEASWERWRKLKPGERQLVVRRLERLRTERGLRSPSPGGSPPAGSDQK